MSESQGWLPNEVRFVCLLAGSVYKPLYVERLFSMLTRHCPVPFTLTVLIDRPHRFRAPVQVVRVDGWKELLRDDYRPTTLKIGLFKREVFDFEEFLYFDVTIVVTKDLTPLLEAAYSSPASLATLKDWNYDCYNTCVMRIRSCDELNLVYEDFVSGTVYPRKNKGDQDFITASLRAQGLESCVMELPRELVQMFHPARLLHRTDPEAAYKMLEQGVAVKFYGWSKMHQLANPVYRLRKLRMKKDRGPMDAKFWVDELKRHWR